MKENNEKQRGRTLGPPFHCCNFEEQREYKFQSREKSRREMKVATSFLCGMVSHPLLFWIVHFRVFRPTKIPLEQDQVRLGLCINGLEPLLFSFFPFSCFYSLFFWLPAAGGLLFTLNTGMGFLLSEFSFGILGGHSLGRKKSCLWQDSNP